MLASLAVDLRITQLVNTVKGVHAVLAKGIFQDHGGLANQITPEKA